MTFLCAIKKIKKELILSFKNNFIFMILLNILSGAIFLYFSVFFYYFSFNENFLLVFLFAFFLYVINSKLMGFLFESVDSASLDIYLTFKQMAVNASNRLLYVKSNLDTYCKTSDNVVSSLESFIDLHLAFILFLDYYKDLFFNQVLQLNLFKLLALQNNFVKVNLSNSVNNEQASLLFESE